MPTLVWDAQGEKTYQLGISRGVLYLKDGPVVVWNGLTAMEEGAESELTSYYLDGVKYLENLSPGDFSGQLRAWTYPDELDSVTGVAEEVPGLQYHEQPPRSFNLSYQTKIGNDLNGDAGYKIHLLYNVLARPEGAEFETISEDTQPVEFSWSLTGTPPLLNGYRPTVHVVIDSTKVDPDVLTIIESIIYGTEISNPRFLTVDELRSLFDSVGVLTIIDHGDGTWTAIDASDEYITMDSPTEFTITGADAEYLDPETYEISTTTP